jgi:hypothetical protein
LLVGAAKPILQLSKTHQQINTNYNYTQIYGPSCYRTNDEINVKVTVSLTIDFHNKIKNLN